MGLDDATLRLMREALLAMQADGVSDEDDPIALFDEFLRRLAAVADVKAEGDDEFFESVVMTLTQLAIEANGGDPASRELRGSIYARLDEAIAEGELDAVALVLIAKVLSDSGWDVPDSLKQRVVEALDAEETVEGGADDLGGALLDIAQAAEGDAFATYDALNSVLAAFPSAAAARMVATLGGARAPVLLHAMAGFAMHADAQLARAAIEELKRAASMGPIESLLVERLVRMRPWLPVDRQGALDEAIRALRPHAAAPVEAERPQAAKGFLLACDGSGAGGTLASLKARDGWRFVTAMTKPTGIDDVLSMERLSKAQIDATVRGMREDVVAAQTDIDGVARYLQLALGENLAAGTPPPFKLIAFVENLGLGPLAPRFVSPADLIAEILADLPEAEKDRGAVAYAQAITLGRAVLAPWFEAGEDVERLLKPLKGLKAQVDALMSDYLPQRREFWARALALTAFALREDPKGYGKMGGQLALIGRELVSGAPLVTIPLMRQIAKSSAHAFESRG
ncbi:MAG: hypothetical protein KGM15_00290 [Pseudomonadota bacterium]|nr:hypothetical protein [Pseudomonadota bacterium]